MGCFLPRPVGQQILQQHPHPGGPIRQQVGGQHGAGEIQQPDVEGRAWHAQALLAQGRAAQGQDHWQAGQPEPGALAPLPRQQIGLHGGGQQRGLAATAPPLPQPGQQGQQPEWAQQGEIHHGAPRDGLSGRAVLRISRAGQRNRVGQLSSSQASASGQG